MKIGIVDTTFSRINMGKIALDELDKIRRSSEYKNHSIEHIRLTVPGIKDLAVECQILFESGCDIVVALGMVGAESVDGVCAHESSTAIQTVMLKHSKHIIEVFVHTNESIINKKLDEKDLFNLTNDRVRKHIHNAVWIVLDPQKLIDRAGSARRQGRDDEKQIKV